MPLTTNHCNAWYCTSLSPWVLSSIRQWWPLTHCCLTVKYSFSDSWRREARLLYVNLWGPPDNAVQGTWIALLDDFFFLLIFSNYFPLYMCNGGWHSISSELHFKDIVLFFALFFFFLLFFSFTVTDFLNCLFYAGLDAHIWLWQPEVRPLLC